MEVSQTIENGGFTVDSQRFYLIAGGDGRYIRLGVRLAETARVCAVGFSQYPDETGRVECLASLSELKESPDCLILPMPVTKDGESVSAPFSAEKLPLGQVLDLCRRDTLVLGGLPGERTVRLCAERGLRFDDYAAREELAVLNAVPTAEGALQIALEQLPVVLNGLPVLIAGYGRVAKLCRRAFAGVGCKVSVAARSRKDLAWAEADGAEPIPLSRMGAELPRFRLVLNTVPHLIFREEELALLPSGALLLDLASAPGGTDFAAANRLGIAALPALSLPGKAAPETAAEILFRTIRNIETERRDSRA